MMTIKELFDELSGSNTAYKISCMGEHVLVSTDSVNQVLRGGRV